MFSFYALPRRPCAQTAPRLRPHKRHSATKHLFIFISTVHLLKHKSAHDAISRSDQTSPNLVLKHLWAQKTLCYFMLLYSNAITTICLYTDGVLPKYPLLRCLLPQSASALMFLCFNALCDQRASTPMSLCSNALCSNVLLPRRLSAQAPSAPTCFCPNAP